MRSLLSLAFVTLCTVGQLAPHAPKETSVVDAAVGADFVARSEVEPRKAGGFTLTNTIRNRAATPLAVDWPAGGFFCTIPPGATQAGENTNDWLMNPTAVLSEVKYGARHQYQRKADVFIEPKAPDSAQVSEAEYYLEDEGKRRSRRIVVTARRGGEGVTTLSVQMPSAMLLAIPLSLADALRETQEFMTGPWKDLGVVKPAELAPRDGTFGAVAAQMFGIEGAQLISNTAPVGQTARLTARQSGAAAAPRPLYFAIIDQERTSVFAFRAFVFAQPAARAGR